MKHPSLARARSAAGLTQTELAGLAGTSQSAIAAYESGSKLPSLNTLQRLLENCGYEVSLDARPRVRRGATSLAQMAPVIAADLANGAQEDALRLIYGFVDDFRGSPRAGKLELIAERPGTTGDRRFDALLAATAEFLSAEGHIPAPEWADAQDRYVEPWFFVTPSPDLHAYALARTPIAFARHGVFIAREVFTRA